MDADFIDPADPRWMAFLHETPHDFYHLPAYVELSARYEGGEPMAFYAEDGPRKMLIPLLKRAVPEDLGPGSHWRDVTSPYGYPCPLVTPGCDADLVAWFLSAFIELGWRDDLVSAFFRLHPLWPLPGPTKAESGKRKAESGKEKGERGHHDEDPAFRFPLSAFPFPPAGQVVLHGPTVYVDLTLSREELWRQTRPGHRNDIHKLQRLGFRAVMDDWGLFGDFVATYRDTMRRLEASPFYFFDDDYFRGCRALAGEGMHLCCVLAPSGEVAAAGLFTAVGGVVQYHLSGSAESYSRLAPNKLMLDAVRWWDKDQGYARFHLGGGVGAVSQSLFHFKAGFSELRAEFHTWRLVLDAVKHEHLVSLWRKRHPAMEPAAGFFPEYRAAPAIAAKVA
jgi:hypothetical protein